MLEFFGKALEWLGSPKRWAAVFIVCVVLLLLPRHLAERMRLADVREHYLPWISLCGIFSSAVLLVELAVWLKTPVKSIRERRDRKAVLLSLTPPEMRVIAEYFRQQTDTQYFSATDGLAGGLAAKGLIYQSSTVSHGLTPVFAFNLQPWARETLRRNPGVLQAFMVIANRKSNT
jgi:hypothetical protein